MGPMTQSTKPEVFTERIATPSEQYLDIAPVRVRSNNLRSLVFNLVTAMKPVYIPKTVLYGEFVQSG